MVTNGTYAFYSNPMQQYGTHYSYSEVYKVRILYGECIKK